MELCFVMSGTQVQRNLGEVMERTLLVILSLSRRTADVFSFCSKGDLKGAFFKSKYCRRFSYSAYIFIQRSSFCIGLKCANGSGDFLF